jgi:hypothetical protein
MKYQMKDRSQAVVTILTQFYNPESIILERLVIAGLIMHLARITLKLIKGIEISTAALLNPQMKCL